MNSITGLLKQLEEKDPFLIEHALIQLVKVVDFHWHEVSEVLPLIESLSEDDTFQGNTIAAGLASRCFYHLEEYEDALRLALDSGKYFNFESTNEYEVTIVGKAIDKYIQLQKDYENEKKDLKFEKIIEIILERFCKLGNYKQALSIIIEARRLDKIVETIENSGTHICSLLTYCVDIAQNFVANREFRNKFFSTLIRLYENLEKDKCNYIELATCLYHLEDTKKVGQLLCKLIIPDDSSSNNLVLMAYQIAFDLVELQDQRFIEQIFNELSYLPSDLIKDSTLLNLYNQRLTILQKIIGENFSTTIYLNFLYHHNRTDPILFKQIKSAEEQGRKSSMLHNSALVAHSYLQAGTAVDSFLRNNLEWLGRANNWSKFTATASLGVIHKGNVQSCLSLLKPYLPEDINATVSSSPYSEGGALFALGLIHASQGYSSATGSNAFKYLQKAIDSTSKQENESAREVLQHGACLGIGLMAMHSCNSELTEKLQEIVYCDNAVSGEAAALAIGMIMLKSGLNNTFLVEDMLSYSKDTEHEKITRSLGLGISMIMYGQEELADTLIENLCADKNAIIRYGGMYTIGMAYVGTANKKAIKRLLHVAVSDVNNDVRRAAVINIGFVMINLPDQLPDLISLLLESYNPYVRYGACMALAIGCCHMTDPSSALQILEHLMDDKIDFVTQIAYISSAILLCQHNPESNPQAAALRTKLQNTISNFKHSPIMSRMGALMALGIIDAGGRNVTIDLNSRWGVPKPSAVIGMMLWTQYWYWYPMMLMISLSFTPTALIGVNENLDLPVEFKVDCTKDLIHFNYPNPIKEKKKKSKLVLKQLYCQPQQRKRFGKQIRLPQTLTIPRQVQLLMIQQLWKLMMLKIKQLLMIHSMNATKI